MRIIEIDTLYNGSHRNQNSDGVFIPEGWAVIPDDMETPNFPFGKVTAKEIDGVMTVTKWVAGTIPEVEPVIEPIAEPTTDEIMNVLLGVAE
jgi:hypothetical protein